MILFQFLELIIGNPSKQNNFWISFLNVYTSDGYIERRNYDGIRFADDNGNPRKFGPFEKINNICDIIFFIYTREDLKCLFLN